MVFDRKAWMKEYYEQHKEHLKQYSRTYCKKQRTDNREEYLAKKRANNVKREKENPGGINRYLREWRQKNKDKIRQYKQTERAKVQRILASR